MPKLQNNIVLAIMGINLAPNYASLISDLVQSDNPFSRENSLAHITASGLVIDSKKVLLIFHPYIKRWFQPGGHIDPNENPSEAAIGGFGRRLVMFVSSIGKMHPLYISTFTRFPKIQLKMNLDTFM